MFDSPFLALLAGTFLFGATLVLWYLFKNLVIVGNARRDGWLKTCSWMFESGVLDDFLFFWRVVWKYVPLQHSDVILCTECTYSDSFSSVALCFVCPPRGSFTASLCSVLWWGARRHLVDDSRFVVSLVHVEVLGRSPMVCDVSFF